MIEALVYLGSFVVGCFIIMMIMPVLLFLTEKFPIFGWYEKYIEWLMRIFKI